MCHWNCLSYCSLSDGLYLVNEMRWMTSTWNPKNSNEMIDAVITPKKKLLFLHAISDTPYQRRVTDTLQSLVKHGELKNNGTSSLMYTNLYIWSMFGSKPQILAKDILQRSLLLYANLDFFPGGTQHYATGDEFSANCWRNFCYNERWRFRETQLGRKWHVVVWNVIEIAWKFTISELNTNFNIIERVLHQTHTTTNAAPWLGQPHYLRSLAHLFQPSLHEFCFFLFRIIEFSIIGSNNINAK